MVDAGFHPDFPQDVLREIDALKPPTAVPVEPLVPPVRDLRSLPWSSIDNDQSRDLDQIEYAERSGAGVRLLIGIAEVDAAVERGSATDRQAAAQTGTVYTGVTTFPMLPPALSTGLTSLLQAEDRRCVVLELHVRETGEVESPDVFLATVRNHAKLDYGSVGAWLEGRSAPPPGVTSMPGLEAQLRLQFETSERLRGLRKQHGALSFGSLEASPVVDEGTVKGLAIRQHSMAEDVIESFMLAANVAMAQYLKNSTAPNRRYADLVTQRLLKAAAAGGAALYTQTELSDIAAHCTEREDAARIVERLMRKVIAASFLSGRVGEAFDGIVTGASPKGTYVRLLQFPAEGRVVRGTQGIDVGDKVHVRLVSVDIARDYVDFETL
jgi:exoribonuclease R